MKNAKFDRQSNIELLRIIAMIMIVAHHFAVHGGFEFSSSITLNRVWIRFIQMGGKIGVNIFVLISGYFLITAVGIKTSKVLKLWLQIFTYSILIFIIFAALGIQPFGMKELIKSIFPITFSQWWFANTYFVFYLLTPYLNKLLNSLDKKNYQRMLILLTLCWCIIPTFLTRKFESNSLTWFVYLYSLAGYIRLYVNKIKIKAWKYILAAFTVMMLTYLSAVVFDILGTRFSFFENHVTYFYDMQRLPVVFISICMFIGFIKIDIGYKKFINVISLATFGVYLIHDNVYISPFLWKTLFKNALFFEKSILLYSHFLFFAYLVAFQCLMELSKRSLILPHLESFQFYIKYLCDAQKFPKVLRLL